MRSRLVAGTLLCAAFFGCLGGSDGVENPKLTLDVKRDDGTSLAYADVSLFPKDRDPVKDSVPLLERTFLQGKVELTPASMDSVLGTKDTVLDFNVVALSDDREALSLGYRYTRAGNRAGFSRVPAVAGAQGGGYGSVTETLLLPQAVQGFAGRIGGQGAALGLDYVFIPGSPYHGSVADQGFLLPRLAPGVFGLVGVDRDSAKAFLSADSLNTADTAFTAKAWGEITFVQ